MAERRRYGEVPVVPGPRTSNVPGSAAPAVTSAADVFAKGMYGISESINDRLDKQAAADAALEGSKAGRDPNVQMRDPTTIAGASFNRAATTSYLTNIEITGRQAVRDIYSKNSANPQELQKGFDAWLSGTMKSMEEIAPHVSREFKMRYQAWTAPYMRRATSNYEQNFRENAYGLSAFMESEAAKDIDMAAGDLFSSDPVAKQQATVLLGDHIATVGRAMRQQAELGEPLAPQMIASREQQIIQRAASQGVKSWFQQQPDKANAFLQWKTGNLKLQLPQPDGTLKEVSGRDVLTDAGRADIDNWLSQEMQFSVATAEHAGAMLDKLEQSERNRNEFDAWSRVYTADVAARLTAADVAALVNRRAIDPEAGKQMLETLNREENQRDDNNVMIAIENQIYNGTNSRNIINTSFKNGQLTGKTASRLLALNEREVFPDRDKPQDPYSRMRKLLHESTQQKGPMAVDFGGEPERRARAMMEYDQLTLQEGMDPTQAYEEVLARTKVGMGQINTYTERMILPRFAVGGRESLDVKQTGIRLREAFDKRMISQTELIEEVRRLKEWQQALEQTQAAAAANAQRKKGK